MAELGSHCQGSQAPWGAPLIACLQLDFVCWSQHWKLLPPSHPLLGGYFPIQWQSHMSSNLSFAAGTSVEASFCWHNMMYNRFKGKNIFMVIKLITVFLFSKGHGNLFISVEHNEVSEKLLRARTASWIHSNQGIFSHRQFCSSSCKHFQTELFSTCIDR